MNFWNSIKALFIPPAPDVMAAQEYDIARRSLLEAHTAREYAEAMVMYQQNRIKRLKATLAGEDK